MALTLRLMAPHEVPLVAGIWRRSRQAAQPWLEERVPRSVAEDEARIRHLAATGEIWVAVEHGVVVGMLAQVGRDIDLLFVEPTSQGRGVGTALLDHAKADAPLGLALFTHQRNADARRFYERRGFRVVRLGFSPPPEDEPDVLYEWKPPPETMNAEKALARKILPISIGIGLAGWLSMAFSFVWYMFLMSHERQPDATHVMKRNDHGTTPQNRPVGVGRKYVLDIPPSRSLDGAR